MKNIFLLLFVLVLAQNITYAQFIRVWEKSDALNNLPLWFSQTATRERGIAFGKFGGIPKLYVISNLAQPTVIILDAMTGDSLGTLNTDGINGGLLFLSDISVRTNEFYPYTPALYACNLIVNPPFKIYVWESDTSAPQLLIEDFFSTFRVGDHLSTGVDWQYQHFITASSNNNRLVDYYSPTGNPPFTRREVFLSDGNTSNNASADFNYVYPYFAGGNYIVNSDGSLPKFYDTLGIFQSVSSIVSTSSNSIKYYANGSLCCDLPLYVSYQYDENNAALVLSNGPPYENLWGETPSLGNNPNPDNYGDVEYAWIEWNKLYIYVISGNNGIGAYYAPGLALPVELSSFTAENLGTEVLLKWQTATEKNNSGFEILRFAQNDNNGWDKIGFIPGHGTTTETHHYSLTDNDIKPGKYQYKLKQIDYDGTFEYSQIVEVEIPVVNEFSLEQNYPNPFNPNTKIKYSVAQLSQAQIKVYDVLGNEVATLVNEEKPSGSYEIEFNATNLPSGVYFYQLKAGSFLEIKKMVLLK